MSKFKLTNAWPLDLTEETTSLDFPRNKAERLPPIKHNVGLVSVGHRPSLRQYHTLLLDLSESTATMAPLSPAQTTEALPDDGPRNWRHDISSIILSVNPSYYTLLLGCVLSIRFCIRTLKHKAEIPEFIVGFALNVSLRLHSSCIKVYLFWWFWDDNQISETNYAI
jgi:hypothetical protein